MEQGLCVRIILNSSIECVKYKFVIIAVADGVGYDTLVLEVEDSTEICFATVVFKFGNIC